MAHALPGLEDPHPPAQVYGFGDWEINSVVDFLWWLAHVVLTLIGKVVLVIADSRDYL